MVRLKLSVFLAKSAGIASQKLLGKSGATIPGLILLKIFPKALTSLSKDRVVVLISGTNGKTSTTRALTKSIEGLGTITSNGTGSNLDRGAVTALMKKSKFAVLEVDELHLSNVAKAVNPKIVLLLNLTRDQLHRMHEVKKVAQRWRDLAQSLPDTLFVGDVDDPFVAYALDGAIFKKRISFGGRRHEDGAVCPACGNYQKWSGKNYKCSCGLTNKNADIDLEAGSAAARNAQLANWVAQELGARVSAVNESDLERSVHQKFNGVETKIRLTKNPASWREALSGVKNNNVILILNAREVDGIDTSWLWDIDFSILKNCKVVVMGERALDMVYRLHVQGISATEAKDFNSATKLFQSGSSVDVLAAYTAFHSLVGA